MSEVLFAALNMYPLLSAEEKAACATGLGRGYLIMPRATIRATTGPLWLYYGAVCVLNRQPVVALIPNRAGKWTLMVSLPETNAFQQIVDLVVEAGIEISLVCRYRMGLFGLVDEEHAEPVAKLLSRKARSWCATYRGLTYDVQ